MKTIRKTALLFLIGLPCLPGQAGRAETTLENCSYKPGQFEITARTGEALDQPLTVRVLDDGTPQEGVKVYFCLTQTPSGSTGATLKKTEAFTGADGSASTSFVLGDKSGDYRVEAFVPEAENSPEIFQVSAKSPAWLIGLILSLFGSLAVFLFGMMYMSDSIHKLGGRKFESFIERCTSNRFKALTVGTVVTALIQSSSATTVMVVGLINGGLMQFGQSIGIILGANIGTTITAQIVAFKLTDYALWFVLFGFLLKFTGGTRRRKLAGDAVIGFGLLFFGMKLMGEVTQPLRTYQPFIDLLLSLENPVIGVLAGAVFTTLIQSSSAATGVYIALSFQGLMNLEAAIPLIFGANIGTCTTALLASIGASREAKRAALAHVIFNGLKVCLFLPFIPLYRDLIFSISPHPPGSDTLTSLGQVATYAPRMIANAHSVAKIVAVTLALPFTNQLARLCQRILPITEKEKSIGPKYLNPSLLHYPEMALTVTKKEVLRMGGYALGMLDTVLRLLRERRSDLLSELFQGDEKVDILYKEIRPYLAQITQEELDPQESFQETQIVIVAEELENFGDVISKSLASSLTKYVEHSYTFSPADWEHILDFHKKVGATLSRALDSFRHDDCELARQVISEREQMNIYYKALHIAHLQKHRSGVAETIQTSSLYLNILADFRQLHTLSLNIAGAVLESRWAQGAS